jgi:lysine-specific demethylase 8
MFPQYFPDQRQLDVRIWIAAPGQKSTLHNDNYQNFNAQISGVKKFVLFPPEHYPYLYTEIHNEGCWVSRVDAFDPDLSRYPLFTQAKAVTCTLTAGEILYVPLFWWHQVYAETLTVNINAWVYLRSGLVLWSQS